jgi:hypothetical protein
MELQSPEENSLFEISAADGAPSLARKRRYLAPSMAPGILSGQIAAATRLAGWSGGFFVPRLIESRSSTQLEKIQHSRPSGRQAPRSALQLFAIFQHHLDKVFGVPEGLKDRASAFKPALIHRFIEAALRASLVDLAEPFIWRVGFASDFNNQLEIALIRRSRSSIRSCCKPGVRVKAFIFSR